MLKIGKIFLIAAMVAAIAAQPLLCQTKNRIQCAFSNLCQWSENGNCVELQVNEIIPCHNFINSEECGEYSTCTWNALNSTCNTNACDQVDRFYICHTYRECQWIDGIGCQNRIQ
ncbi:hypothetical protein ABPG74_019350 [Tetrahymena malaccensis]